MSVLSWLRRRATTWPEAQPRGLAMVLLPDGAAFDPQAALARMRGYPADAMTIANVTSEQDVTTGEIPGGAFGLVHMPVPVPAPELEGPATVAWHWPTAKADVARHRSHVIVHAGSTTRDILDIRLFHSRLVASVVEAAGAIGVYVGNAMLVRSAADYIDDVRTASRESLPLLSWIGIHPVRDDGDTTSGYTTGLGDFGFIDLEIQKSRAPVSAVLSTLADTAHYQLATGSRLLDGESFGVSETDRRRIRHGPSSFMQGATVAVLEA